MTFDWTKVPSEPPEDFVAKENKLGETAKKPFSINDIPTEPPDSLPDVNKKPAIKSNEDVGFLEQSYRDIAGGLITAGEMGLKTARAIPGGDAAGGWDENGIQKDKGVITKGIEAISEFRKSHPEYEMYEGDGLSSWYHQALSSVATSLAVGGVAAGGGALLAAGTPVVGAALAGGAMLGTVFGASTYDDSYKLAREHGVGDEEAQQYAVLDGLFEAGFEGLAGGLEIAIGGSSKFFGSTAKQALKKGAKEFMSTRLKTLFMKQLAGGLTEASTEMATSAAQTKNAQRLGLTEMSVLESMGQAFGPSFVAGLMFTSAASGGKIISDYAGKKTLMDGKAKPEERLKVAKKIAKEYEAVDPRAAKMWTIYSGQAIKNNEPILIDMSYGELTDKIDNLKKTAEVSPQAKENLETLEAQKEVMDEGETLPPEPVTGTATPEEGATGRSIADLAQNKPVKEAPVEEKPTEELTPKQQYNVVAKKALEVTKKLAKDKENTELQAELADLDKQKETLLDTIRNEKKPKVTEKPVEKPIEEKPIEKKVEQPTKPIENKDPQSLKEMKKEVNKLNTQLKTINSRLKKDKNNKSLIQEHNKVKAALSDMVGKVSTENQRIKNGNKPQVENKPVEEKPEDLTEYTDKAVKMMEKNKVVTNEIQNTAKTIRENVGDAAADAFMKKAEEISNKNIEARKTEQARDKAETESISKMTDEELKAARTAPYDYEKATKAEDAIHFPKMKKISEEIARREKAKKEEVPFDTSQPAQPKEHLTKSGKPFKTKQTAQTKANTLSKMNKGKTYKVKKIGENKYSVVEEVAQEKSVNKPKQQPEKQQKKPIETNRTEPPVDNKGKGVALPSEETTGRSLDDLLNSKPAGPVDTKGVPLPEETPKQQDNKPPVNEDPYADMGEIGEPRTAEIQAITEELNNEVKRKTANAHDEVMRKLKVKKLKQKLSDAQSGKKFSKGERESTPKIGVSSARAESEVRTEIGAEAYERLTKAGKLEIVDSAKDVTGEPLTSEDGEVVGFYENGKITLIADKMPAGKVANILRHEMLHKTMAEDKAFIRKRANILGSFKNLQEKSEAVKAAYALVPEDTAVEFVDEEAFAYYLQNDDNIKEPLFRRYLTEIKMWLYRHGFPAGKLTEKQLVELARQGINKNLSGTKRTQSTRLFMMAGPKAKTLRTAALNYAKDMEDFGATPEEIWEETGFVKIHGHWKYEISDQNTSLGAGLETYKKQLGSKFPLFLVLKHKNLYEAYPQLGEYEVSFQDFTNAKHDGYFDANTNEIVLSHKLSDEQIHSVLLHEAQHAIQDIEEWPTGTNLNDSTKSIGARKEISKIQNDLDAVERKILGGETLNDVFDSFGKDSKEFKAAEDKVREGTRQDPTYRHMIQFFAGMGSEQRVARYFYDLSAGEVEARNTQKRFKYPKMVSNIPTDTMDQYVGNQVVEYRSERRFSKSASEKNNTDSQIKALERKIQDTERMLTRIKNPTQQIKDKINKEITGYQEEIILLESKDTGVSSVKPPSSDTPSRTMRQAKALENKIKYAQAFLEKTIKHSKTSKVSGKKKSAIEDKIDAIKSQIVKYKKWHAVLIKSERLRVEILQAQALKVKELESINKVQALRKTYHDLMDSKLSETTTEQQRQALLNNLIGQLNREIKRRSEDSGKTANILEVRDQQKKIRALKKLRKKLRDANRENAGKARQIRRQADAYFNEGTMNREDFISKNSEAELKRQIEEFKEATGQSTGVVSDLDATGAISGEVDEQMVDDSNPQRRKPVREETGRAPAELQDDARIEDFKKFKSIRRVLDAIFDKASGSPKENRARIKREQDKQLEALFNSLGDRKAFMADEAKITSAEDMKAVKEMVDAGEITAEEYQAARDEEIKLNEKRKQTFKKVKMGDIRSLRDFIIKSLHTLSQEFMLQDILAHIRENGTDLEYSDKVPEALYDLMDYADVLKEIQSSNTKETIAADKKEHEEAFLDIKNNMPVAGGIFDRFKLRVKDSVFNAHGELLGDLILFPEKLYKILEQFSDIGNLSYDEHVDEVVKDLAEEYNIEKIDKDLVKDILTSVEAGWLETESQIPIENNRLVETTADLVAPISRPRTDAERTTEIVNTTIHHGVGGTMIVPRDTGKGLTAKEKADNAIAQLNNQYEAFLAQTENNNVAAQGFRELIWALIGVGIGVQKQGRPIAKLNRLSNKIINSNQPNITEGFKETIKKEQADGSFTTLTNMLDEATLANVTRKMVARHKKSNLDPKLKRKLLDEKRDGSYKTLRKMLHAMNVQTGMWEKEIFVPDLMAERINTIETGGAPVDSIDVMDNFPVQQGETEGIQTKSSIGHVRYDRKINKDTIKPYEFADDSRAVMDMLYQRDLVDAAIIIDNWDWLQHKDERYDIQKFLDSKREAYINKWEARFKAAYDQSGKRDYSVKNGFEYDLRTMKAAIAQDSFLAQFPSDKNTFENMAEQHPDTNWDALDFFKAYMDAGRKFNRMDMVIRNREQQQRQEAADKTYLKKKASKKVSPATVKTQYGLKPSIGDIIKTIEDSSLQPRAEVAAAAKYGKLAKKLGATLRITVDQSSRSSIKDGVMTINMTDDSPMTNIIADHAMSLLDPKYEKETTSIIRDIVGAEEFDRIVDYTMETRGSQDLKAAEQQVTQGYLGKLMGIPEFYERLLTTPEGRASANKILIGMTDMLAKTDSEFSPIAESKQFEEKIISETDEMNKLGDFVRELLIETGAITGKPIPEDSRVYSRYGNVALEELYGYGKKPIKKAKGLLKKVFTPGTKNHVHVMNNIERIVVNLINHIKRIKTKLVFADFMAEKIDVELASYIQHGYERPLNEALAYLNKHHKHTFAKMTTIEKERMYDRVVKGLEKSKKRDKDGKPINIKHKPLDFTKAEDVQAGLDFGMTQDQIDAYKFYKVEADKLYHQLKKYYPDLNYNQFHYGQSIKWKKKNGVQIDPNIEAVIYPDNSKFEGRKQYLLNRDMDRRTSEIAAGNELEYETIDPHELFVQYIGDANKLLYTKKMMGLAGKSGRGVISMNPTAAMEEGLEAVDDPAFNITQMPAGGTDYQIYVSGESLGDSYATEHEAVAALRDMPGVTEKDGVFTTKKGEIVELHKNEQTYERTLIGYGLYYPKRFEAYRTVQTEAEAKEVIAKEGLEGKVEVRPMFAGGTEEVVARMYFKPDLAELLRRIVAKDKFKQASIGDWSGHKLLNLKNKFTAIEFAFSMFHMLTIGNELIASQIALKRLRAKTFGGKLLALNPYTALRDGLKDTRDTKALFTAMLENNDIAKDPAFIAKAEQVLGIKNPDMLDMMNQFFMNGGLPEQDQSLRSDVHNMGKIRYMAEIPELRIENGKAIVTSPASKMSNTQLVRHIAKNMLDSTREVYDKTLANEPESPIKAAFKTFQFASLEASTAWLMENLIPQVKMATWFKEYSYNLERYKDDIASGSKTKHSIGHDTMKFVEDRFGEVNWKNMWMDPSIKSALILTFRSFTWFTGSWKALSKAGIDIGKKGWFKAKGENYELTQKGEWLIGAVFTHILTVGAITAIYGVMAAASDNPVPDDDDVSWLSDLLYPRSDPSDPYARIAIPSYVNELYKILNHLGILGSDFEPSAMVTGRFNSFIGNGFDVYRGYDFRGVKVRNKDDMVIQQALDSVMHIFNILPISISSAMDNYNKKGFDLQSTLFSFFGMTTAPAVAKRSAATNRVFQLTRESFRGSTVSKEELELKDEVKRAAAAYGKGDDSLFKEMIKNKDLSYKGMARAKTYVPTIKGKPNPVYISPLKRALKRLKIEEAIDVWGYMTDDEKKTYKTLLSKKYYNILGRSERSYNNKQEIKKQVKELGIIK